MLVKVGLTAPTVEDAKHYLQRIEDILEWVGSPAFWIFFALVIFTGATRRTHIP